MSAGVTGIPSIGAAGWASQRPAASPPFAPDASADGQKAQAASAPATLRLPEEQAFNVSTINQRLATTAARADGTGAALDVKA